MRLGAYELVGARRKRPFCGVCAVSSLSLLLSVAFAVVVAKFRWVLWRCPYHLHPVPRTVDFMPRSIAFGSCVSGTREADILDQVDADVFVFLGDNVYADTQSPWYMSIMYNRLACMRSFQRMVKRTPFVLAIWDDHDYGGDDADSAFPFKYRSRNIFLDFWKIPPHSERRRGDGIHGAYRFGAGERSISIILPDLRFFRDKEWLWSDDQVSRYVAFHEQVAVNGSYVPTNGSIVGDRQWEWLEAEIRESQGRDDLTIIASSTQLGHSPNGYESWNLYPRDRQRLLALLDPAKSLVISGDVHWGEVSNASGVLDVTSSGLSTYDPNVLPNDNRVGVAYAGFNYGLIDLVRRTASVMTLKNETAVQVSLDFLFDFANRPPVNA